MDDHPLLHTTLEQVVQRIGDPAPRVFARLYAEAPEVQALFLNDTSGSVRAEMFLRALECLQDAAGPGRYGAALVGAEHQTHLGYGVDSALFQRFFVLIVDEFRAALGADWTPAMDAAWGRGLQRLAQAAPAVGVSCRSGLVAANHPNDIQVDGDNMAHAQTSRHHPGPA